MTEDLEQLEIDAMKEANDFSGLGQKLRELFKLPQHLCKTRGMCCKVATFKSNMSYEQLKALAESDDPNASNAREFLTLFIPFETEEEVRAIAPVFVDRVKEADPEKADAVSFFHCRFVGDDGRCMIHEDRPTGCRIYPFPHEKTIYHPGCGFEEKGYENMRKMNDITEFFNRKLKELEEEAQSLESQMDEDESL